MLSAPFFQTKLLNWFEKHGRKTLPWQQERTPYRVLVSEIMLQQTQVKTVIPYFEKFIQTFPTVTHLADACEDSVFRLWGGLGYYTRAKHLHQTAKKIVHTFKGNFPSDVETLQSLPGIGRSTAGAIVALGFNQYAPILDGNVKRILCRLHALDGLPTQTKVTEQLWQIAEAYTSTDSPRDYTQAIMDFGSMICTKHNPRCLECFMSSQCMAYLKNKTHCYPHVKQKQPLPKRQTSFLILINAEHKILLEKRAATGIWGGLWSLPEWAPNTCLKSWCINKYHCKVDKHYDYPPIQHTFSHFRLIIQPIICPVRILANTVIDSAAHSWVTRSQLEQKGLAAPIKKLLVNVFNEASLVDECALIQ